MENEKNYDINEAISKLVIAESKSIEFIISQMDETEIFTKEDFLLTNHHLSQLVNQLVNVKD